jgi:hypothetical protein
MSESVRFRAGDGTDTRLWLPFELDAWLADLGQARKAMMRRVPPAFSRDEWAYLMQSLSPDAVLGAMERVFGRRVHDSDAPVRWEAAPRGTIAIWAPANVSLLAPLVMLAAVASGCPVRLKGSRRAEDLAGAFLAAVRSTEGAEGFAARLRDVEHVVFDRTDRRSTEWAASADVRIVFGSDAAAEAIHAMPHPLESIGFSFTDRRSEVWIEPSAVTEETLRDLAAVFAIYGQAGCTSPARVVLVDATPDATRDFAQRLAAVWPQAVRRQVDMHTASQVTRAMQVARAHGWETALAPSNAAVLACGPVDAPRTATGTILWISGASMSEALATVPANLQTVGHAVSDPGAPRWSSALFTAGARRWVPIRQMHHFGWTWDGEEWWRRLYRFRESMT